jgi:signal transduction histidine kinase
MTSIIEDLLVLARLEGPERSRLETARIEAANVLEKAVESLGEGPAARGCAIIVDAEAGLFVLANEGLLEQALVNLLDNAVKYGPRGATVRADALAAGDYIRFTIRDEGPGIPAKDLPRLFERFYRVDRARSRELGGTGLGLAIVRHIALAHGGEASVASKEGSGSAFSLLIPRADAPGTDSVQAASPAGETPTVSS